MSIDGTPVFAESNLADQDYVHETLVFTASGASTLSLFAFNDQSYLELDDVAVTSLPVPEPGGLPLLAAGLLMTGIALRRRGRS